jgi:ABC-type branched-subunit amino acid transport system substrate-binding protein
MYLDALAGWFVRAGFRDWFIVSGDDAESRSQLERVRWTLREKHFAAREAGSVTLAEGGDAEAAAAAARANADLVLLLLPADRQLGFLVEYEAAGAPTPVTGMPYPEAQTREFFLAAAEASPSTGSGHRAVAWAATLDAYGARELNARYLARWGEPMELSAWAAYQAVKILFEGSSFSGGATGRELADFLAADTTVFDVWKGIGASFRPWDHQLRQSLYLIEIDPTAERPLDMELLVGELPAIYMPGTDPVERLDQLGDLAANSSCSF